MDILYRIRNAKIYIDVEDINSSILLFDNNDLCSGPTHNKSTCIFCKNRERYHIGVIYFDMIESIMDSIKTKNADNIDRFFVSFWIDFVSDRYLEFLQNNLGVFVGEEANNKKYIVVYRAKKKAEALLMGLS